MRRNLAQLRHHINTYCEVHVYRVHASAGSRQRVFIVLERHQILWPTVGLTFTTGAFNKLYKTLRRAVQRSKRHCSLLIKMNYTL